MIKYSHLQSSIKLSHLEARLNKNAYLSKSSLPTGVDAKIFLFFERLKKIPNRTTHPNLYHWYILMKQFSPRTLESWVSKHEGEEEDKIIDQYIQFEITSASKENSWKGTNTELKQKSRKHSNNGEESEFIKLLTPNNTSKKYKNSGDSDRLYRKSIQSSPIIAEPVKTMLSYQTEKTIQNRQQTSSPNSEAKYVMQMQIKTEKSTTINALRQKFQQQKLQLLSIEGQQGNVRVILQTELGECEKLKDRISQWKEVSNLQFRKQKKGGLMKGQCKSEKCIISPREKTGSFNY